MEQHDGYYCQTHTVHAALLQYATSLPLANLFEDCLVCNIIGQLEKSPIVIM